MCGTTGICFPSLGYEVIVQTKALRRMLRIEFFGKNFFPMVPNPALNLAPVSYTQLDVYKRQILAISADGKGVVMLPRDLREPTRSAAQSASNKLTKRLAKGEKKNRKRMATVAAVYSVCLLYTSRCV